jgi:alpha-galactosidase
MVQIGGHEATLLDFEIPARHGLRQTIADTLGIGGIFRTLRTAPHMLALGREMADLCPDAWLLNYTNPMAMLCWLVYAGTPTQKVVGLCHSVQATTRDLAELVGVPLDEVAFRAAGVNHQAFILRFERDGESLYPLLDARIDADPDLQRRFRVELYRRFGYFPTESSEHAAEYVPWVMRHDDELERFRTPVDEYIRRSEENLVEYAQVRDALGRGERVEVRRSSEYASLIVNAIETGEPCVIYGNVRNAGLIPNLPADACVEVPCLVDRNGVQGVPVLDYPAELAALNRTFLNPVELTVRAVLEERPELVRLAAMLDPNAGASLTLDEIDVVVEELLDAHAEALPAALRREKVSA